MKFPIWTVLDGSYSISVDGLSGSFIVVAPAPPAPPSTPESPVKPAVNWPLIGGVIGGVLVAVWLIFLLVRRRRAY